jgi:serine phosphatase RsbU (regulator of sigma subunit)/HAMP domain-containing protein
LVDSISNLWKEKELLHKDSLYRDIDHLMIIYSEIMRALPNFKAYEDPDAVIMVDDQFMVNSTIPTIFEQIDRQMQVLTDSHRASLESATAEMNAKSDQLQWYLGNISLFVLISGVIIAIMVSRSIVKPVRELKRTLLYLGKGIYPKRKVKVTADEVGDMAFAVNRLLDGLKKTREFSQHVGAGNFEATYQPLSEEDELGHALLKMRDDLAINERMLEKKVELRTNEVVRQKEEIERQKEKVTNLYNDLTDSINYAKRIQQAILPTKDQIMQLFPESFVFYKPRDIVSGDFYWFKSSGSKKLVAVVDCTGHGVPGAFMSLVGHNVLNQVTKVFTRPSQILNNLNRLSSEALKVSSDRYEFSDGMDLAFFSVDEQTLMLEYAGAHNPLIIARGHDLITLKPDKYAIGSFEYSQKEYTNHTYQLEPGDMIYGFSDGFADQFGGPRGKKFLKKRFRGLLGEIHHLTPREQHDRLNEALITWKRSEDQVDDILVVGIRV